MKRLIFSHSLQTFYSTDLCLFSSHCSPSLLDPILKSLSYTSHLVHGLVIAHLAVCLARLDKVLDTFSCPDVVVCQDRVFLLVLPGQIADISGGDGNDVVSAGDASDDRDDASEEDVAVAGNDASGHGGDQDVD